MSKHENLMSMITELRRGTLTLVVLSQCQTPQYGYSLLHQLEALGVSLDASTLYPMLRRLDKQGILKSEWDTQEARPRKYYVLSEAGVAHYHALKEEWNKLKHEMRFLED